MTTRTALLAIATAICLTPQPAAAYELRTHAQLTNRAFERSMLSTTAGLSRLGLVDTADPFSTAFYDFTESDTYKRHVNEFELERMPQTLPSERRIRGWLMRGAIREDDGGLVMAIRNSEPIRTDPDPFGLLDRFCNHFFDPVNLRGLTPRPNDFETPLLCVNGNRRRSPDWAMGTDDAFGSMPQAAPNYRNHFTFFTAREAMWRALTMLDRNGGAANRAFGDSNAQMRKAYWASTFRALGDVVHLLQDMAQPQHARNEPHGYGHAAIYERYIEARAGAERKFVIDDQTLSVASGTLTQLLLAPDYPVPSFNKFSDYWSTSPGSGSTTPAGKGLADYSGRGFLTPANNVNDPLNEFELPSRDHNAYASETAGLNDECQQFGLLVRYLKGTVPDSITGQADAVRMASGAVLSDRFGLNRCVFDDRATLLLPRAVAYSAGILNYFFRGSLQISLPDAGVYGVVDHATFAGQGAPTSEIYGFTGFGKIKLNFSNATPDITAPGGVIYPQSMGGGVLFAVMKFHRNICYRDDLSGENGGPNFSNVAACRTADEEIVVSRPKSVESVSTDPTEYEFIFDQHLPINATDVYLQVAFRGVLGAEQDAVAVGTRDLSEPSYGGFLNATDYILIENKVYTREQVAGDSDLLKKVQPRSCSLDNDTRLSDTCFQPKSISTWIQFKRPESNAPTGLELFSTDLPPKRFTRFALLTDAGRVHTALRQETCALTPVDHPYSAYSAQVNFDANGQPLNDFSTVHKIRGTWVWELPSCVLRGDNLPYTFDNRDTVMTDIDNKQPHRLDAFIF